MVDPTTVGPVTQDTGTLEREDQGWRIVQHESVRLVTYEADGDTYYSAQVLGTDGSWHEVAHSASEESICGHVGALGGDGTQLRQKICPDGGHDDLGVRLRETRRRRDQSQRDVAEELDVSVDTVRSWESGRRSPSGLYRRALEDWLED